MYIIIIILSEFYSLLLIERLTAAEHIQLEPNIVVKNVWQKSKMAVKKSIKKSAILFKKLFAN